MRSPISRRIIRPKFSTMPRQKDRATAYLQIYQLAVEKKRLEGELQAIEARKLDISKRLGAIAQQINGLEHAVDELESDRLTSHTDTNESQTIQDPSESPSHKPCDRNYSNPGYNLKTMTLDY